MDDSELDALLDVDASDEESDQSDTPHHHHAILPVPPSAPSAPSTIQLPRIVVPPTLQVNGKALKPSKQTHKMAFTRPACSQSCKLSDAMPLQPVSTVFRSVFIGWIPGMLV